MMAGRQNEMPSNSGSLKKTPHTVNHAGQALASFDPLQLLNPKQAQVASRKKTESQNAAAPKVDAAVAAPPPANGTPQFTFTSPSSCIEDDANIYGGPAQMLIERMHNVEERRPEKRHKRSVSPTGSNADRSSKSQVARGGSGLISSHIKDTRKRLAESQLRSPGGTEATRRQIEDSLVENQPLARASGEAGGVVDLTAMDTEGDSGADRFDLTEEPVDGESNFYVVNGKKIYTGNKDPDDREVCYGRIEGARIMCHTVPDTGKQISSRSEWPPMAVKLQRSSNRHNAVIRAIDPKGNDFGNVDTRIAFALKPYLDGNFNIRMEARTDIRTKKHFEAPGQHTNDSIVVHINLFGPFKYAVNPVGSAFTRKQIWLRNPKTIGHNVEVYNPQTNDHQLSKMAQQAARKNLSSISYNPGFRSRTVEETQNEVQSLFDNLQKTDELPRMDADSNVTSQLLDHQKQALAWMTQRERPVDYAPGRDSPGTLWRCNMKNGQLIYHNVVTSHETHEKPPDTLGGLLADVMGLGKTLSLLALISYTRLDAADFENNAPQQMHEKYDIPLRNMKATLLVCPVSVITNWEDQILQHIRDKGLTYYSYHGSSRKKNLDYLSQFDVILTSYSIVKSEMFPSNKALKTRSYGPLASSNFFRVVLDEAHTIRSQTTQQFIACNGLCADRRWALTATPVQNRLEDLGAIIRFLKVSPFHEPSVFTQHITAPFKVADPEVLKHLRLLVDSITLRRNKNTIDLAPRKDETVTLCLNEHEQKLYQTFAQDASKKLQNITSNMQARRMKLGSKGYMNILRSILCLRQICTHGKDLLKDEDQQMIEGQSFGSAIDVEEHDARPALEAHVAYSIFEVLRESSAMCASCKKTINTAPSDLPDNEDEVFCTMLPCFQVICNECIKDYQKKMECLLKEGKERAQCCFCDDVWRIQLFPITASGVVQEEQRRLDLAKQPKMVKLMSRYDGPSTKVIELITRLQNSALESVSLTAAGEKPIKSVVFSAWTTNLDLISIALDQCNIEYCKLVGSMSRPQRRESLERFRNSNTCNVFLVSIGTGGVGLNLTAASRVYLMDIGFNPMAEQQAVDRVHRLGQTREVIFTRFIIRNSIEGKILELQKKKMDLADLSLQRGKIDRAEAVRARLEELKDLFR